MTDAERDEVIAVLRPLVDAMRMAQWVLDKTAIEKGEYSDESRASTRVRLAVAGIPYDWRREL